MTATIQPVLENTLRYRPTAGTVVTGVVIGVALIGVAGFVIAGDLGGLLRYAWPLPLFSLLAWTLFARPSLTVDNRGVTVTNVFRTMTVPWSSVRDIETRHTVIIVTKTRRIPVWALSSNAKRGAARKADEAVQALHTHWDSWKAHATPSSDSMPTGADLAVIRHWATIVGLSALLVVSLVAPLI